MATWTSRQWRNENNLVRCPSRSGWSLASKRDADSRRKPDGREQFHHKRAQRSNRTARHDNDSPADDHDNRRPQRLRRSAPTPRQKSKLNITGPQTAKLAEDISFEITITNRGTTAATGLSVTDRFDRGLTHGTDVSPIRPNANWAICSPANRRDLHLNFALYSPAIFATPSKSPVLVVLSVTNQACISVPTEQPRSEPPALTVTIRTQQSIYRVGDLPQFTIEIVNQGPTVAAKDVRAAIVFEDALRPTRAQKANEPGCTLIPRGVEYSVDTLRPGERLIRVVECECVSPTQHACGSVTVTNTSQTPLAGEQCVQILAAQTPGGSRAIWILQLACNDNPSRVGQ